MGCGSSSAAQPLPVVPEPAKVDVTKPHKVQVTGQNGIASQMNKNGANGLPPGLASFKNGPQAANIPASPGTSSQRGSVFADGLAPLKTTPKGSHIMPSVNPSPMALDASNAPPGSQIPGLNYCTPEFFPTHMEQCWNHYAKPPEYKLIDKAGLKLMAEDAVKSFLESAKRGIMQENPKWDDKKVETKLNLLRGQFLPGSKIEDSMVIATHFLAHELKFQAGEDSKSSGVTKPCFFLHFQRAHRILFSYTPGAEITLERELIVQKLNKQGVDRANKGLRSLTAKSATSNGTASQKGSRSVKASARHKSKKSGQVGNKSDSTNIFGNLDFSGPPQPVPENAE